MFKVKSNDKEYVCNCGDGYFMLVFNDEIMKNNNITPETANKINNMLQREGKTLEQLDEILTHPKASEILAKYNLTLEELSSGSNELSTSSKINLISSLFNVDKKYIEQEMDYETIMKLISSLMEKYIEINSVKKELLKSAKTNDKIKTYNSNL